MFTVCKTDIDGWALLNNWLPIVQNDLGDGRTRIVFLTRSGGIIEFMFNNEGKLQGVTTKRSEQWQ